MQSILDELNPHQREAVEALEGPILVIAGAGSGKTRVITARIMHLVNKGISPYQLLAMTFTNKAALEMKSRVAELLGRDVRDLTVTTFHSFCSRFLRREIGYLDRDTNFVIYDTSDQTAVLKRCIRNMGLKDKDFPAARFRNKFSYLKNQADIDAVPSSDMERQLFQSYKDALREQNAMDFDDLLLFTVQILKEHADCRERYQNRFRYMMVDEYQDTNAIQAKLIQLLLNEDRNLCVVGDEDQSIYGWRGAEIRNILDFDVYYPDARIFKLEQNYRSTEHIVQAANEIITHNRKQIQKKIWSDKGQGNKIKVIKAMTDNEEGKRVADTISEQKSRFHLSNKDIAILYRTNAQSPIFEEYLRRYNIQYRVFGGLSFYQRKEVKDLIAYLRLVVNSSDEEALRRVVNYPKRGIGKTTIEKLGEIANSTNQTMWECLPNVPASTRARNSIAEFQTMIKAGKQKLPTDNAYELATYIAKRSGLIDLLKADTSIEGMGRLENINALLDGINAFVEDDTFTDTNTVPDKSLASYLQNIALLTDFDDKNKDGDFVTLMSVHSAKGLEFKSIFVVGLEENLFPSSMALDSKEGLDEERRLFYVAVTRAELFLTLSFANSRYRFGKMRFNQASRFLEEIPPIHLESTGYVRSKSGTENVSRGARVMGNFKKPQRAQANRLMVDPATFKPNAPAEIQVGMKILHMKFGEGKVLSIDGGKDNRVATIYFQGVENPERRIMLRFAKLQILS